MENGEDSTAKPYRPGNAVPAGSQTVARAQWVPRERVRPRLLHCPNAGWSPRDQLQARGARLSASGTNPSQAMVPVGESHRDGMMGSQIVP